MVPTREEALKGLKGSFRDILESGVRVSNIGDFLESASYHDPPQEQLILAEAATRYVLDFLRIKGPLYPEFKSHLWQQFAESSNIKKELDYLVNSDDFHITIPKRYYDFIRGMFERSGKTRYEFYSEMLKEAGIIMEFDSISFGAAAMKFVGKAVTSVHREHLLVFYSVELLLRAHVAANPGGAPISDAKLETFYRHFEAATPLANKFKKYAEDDSLFVYSAKHWLLPSVDWCEPRPPIFGSLHSASAVSKSHLY